MLYEVDFLFFLLDGPGAYLSQADRRAVGLLNKRQTWESLCVEARVNCVTCGFAACCKLMASVLWLYFVS